MIDSFVSIWLINKGSSPKSPKVDASERGALLGMTSEVLLGATSWSTISGNTGLEVNKDETTRPCR